eukprot:CAMPEP_0206296386 /NCGR_PEP_ID=MMETSP0106_2-20121207/5642_1 /ASSEMBLY_ACC=CAM_ASM_000206 /TAXON_ID=81532 /ORGANISM="Acanthoeca-like sp., Strain 10tr" /LENGTH=965 /DNA_ID=CAMNT_0053727043 /DNA_START=257 /DNA_END=3154 /DNA_ORIENTATION=+
MSDLDKREGIPAPSLGGRQPRQGGGRASEEKRAVARSKSAPGGKHSKMQPHHSGRGRGKGKGKNKGRDRRGRGRGRSSDSDATRMRSGGSDHAASPSSVHKCPVCSLSMTAAAMGAHLDTCLAINASPMSGSGTPDKHAKRNKKGIDISHLMAFAPRQRASSNEQPRPRRRPKTSRVRMAYSREKFLQTNCRFRVKHGGDYVAALADPDRMVDWESIVEVLLTVNEEPRCPICLDAPLVAKITRCGHVYCWHCMLHHLSVSAKDWQACPLCDDFVYERDLRSVSWTVIQLPAIGRKIKMRLLKRERGTLLPLPADEWDTTPPALRSAPVALLTDQRVNTNYFKIVPVTVAERNAMCDLHTQRLREAQAVEPDPYIDKALKELEKISVRRTAARGGGGGGGGGGTSVPGWSSEADSDLSDIESAGGVWGMSAPGRTRAVSVSSVSSNDSEAPNESSEEAPRSGGDAAVSSRLFGGSGGSAAWAVSAEGTSRDSLQAHSGEGVRANVERTQSAPSPIPYSSWAAPQRGLANASPRAAPASPIANSWGSTDSWDHAPAAAPAGHAMHNDKWGGGQHEPGTYGWWNGADAPLPSTSDPDVLSSSGGPAAAAVPTSASATLMAERRPEKRPLTGCGDGVYSYYQAVDGQTVFLHSLNMRCLLHEFGSVENCPLLLDCPILEIQREVMTPELRKRHKYLGHLPELREFMICELDLRKVLSKETLAHFSKDIEARRTFRKRRNVQEKRQAKQQAKLIARRQQEQDVQYQAQLRRDREEAVYQPPEQAELALWGAAPTPAGVVGGVDLGPTADGTIDQPSPATPHRSFSKAVGGAMWDFGSDPPLSASFDDMPTLADAARAKCGGKSDTERTKSGGKGDSRSVGGVTGTPKVWGPRATSASAQGKASKASREDHEAPPAHESFFAGVEGALSALSSSPDVASPDSGPRMSKKGGKKGKKVILFSTSAIRRDRD